MPPAEAIWSHDGEADGRRDRIAILEPSYPSVYRHILIGGVQQRRSMDGSANGDGLYASIVASWTRGKWSMEIDQRNISRN